MASSSDAVAVGGDGSSQNPSSHAAGENDPPQETSMNDSEQAGNPPPAVAAAAAYAVNQSVAAATTTTTTESGHQQYSDATIAAVFQAVDTLQNVFGFAGDIAQYAVEMVGTDVTTAYNYILDNNLDQDGGGPVVPIDTCPHVKHHVLVGNDDTIPSPFSPCSYVPDQQPTGGAKEDLELVDNVDDDDATAAATRFCPSTENWLCLHCGVVRCSRYVNAHGVAHYETSLVSDPGPDRAGHCIAASFSDLSVWCHACKAYLKGPSVDGIVTELQELKFGGQPQQGT